MADWTTASLSLAVSTEMGPEFGFGMNWAIKRVMHRRYPNKLPSVWLMSDARNDKQLETALARLPRGSGMIFRHYHLEIRARRVRYEALRHACERFGHIMVLSGSVRQARDWRADGIYGPPDELARCQTVSPISGRAFLLLATAHNAREVRKANQSGADIVLISPVFATYSHPGGDTLGINRFAGLSRLSRSPVVALGGMHKRNWKTVRHAAYGWAAIDGLTE